VKLSSSTCGQTGNDFDSGLLGKELMVFYASEDVIGKSPYKVLQRLHGSHMAIIFEQTYISKSNFQQPGYNGLG
jgi:hypothetical protein